MSRLDIKQLNELLAVAVKKDPRLREVIKRFESKPEILMDVLGDVLLKIQEDLNPWKWVPVHPKFFLEDPYFCGKNPETGIGVAATMYEQLKVEFIKAHCSNSKVREVVCTGGIGYGKSYFMELGLVWNLYLLSCYKNPQTYYNLSPASKFALVIISITEKQAKSNMFSAIREMIKQIPYFKENFMFDVKKSTDTLLFANNVELFSGTSAVSSTIGLNIFSAALDEANFFKNIKHSQRSKEADGSYDEALSLYNNLLIRQESRFLKYGLTPGTLYIGSSRQFPNDFTEQRIKIAKEQNDGSTQVLDYNIWTICPSKYSKETFMVEVGQLNKRSRILDGHETDVTGQVIKVPMDFISKFKKDIDNSLRDLAGVAVYNVQPFFGQKDMVMKMFDSSLPRIFSVDKATLSPKEEYRLTEKIIKTISASQFPEKPRYIGLDLGLKKDRTGFAMGYIEDMKIVEKTFFNDETQQQDTIKERMPVVVIELVLEIYPEREFGEVELGRVRFMIFQLKKLGYNIRYGSADGFQSADMQQVLRRKGVNMDYISMDKTTEPYETFRSAVYDGRVKCIYHPKLEEECFLLERDYINDKVDHSIKGCFIGETEIEMSDGTSLRIDEHKKLIGKLCKTYNTTTKKETISKIIGWQLTKYVEELIELEMENGTIVKCTPDHLFLLTSGQYKRADELTTEDELQD